MSQLSPLGELEHFVELGLGLAREQNKSVLLERILQSAMQLANADGGTIYEVTDEDSLRFSTLINQSLQLHQGGSSDVVSGFQDILYISMVLRIVRLWSAFALLNSVFYTLPMCTKVP